MWIYTKLGFFSIVHKPPRKKDQLLVRTRCRQDLEALSKKLSQASDFTEEIIEAPDSDYAYRMVVPRSVLALFVADLMKNLDYANFRVPSPIMIDSGMMHISNAGMPCMSGKRK